ncbi:MAG: hypothetical protein LC798_19525 [Chloroflexi bacterium]|nr:hypothetical protein [Chloroflexota bacterium]
MNLPDWSADPWFLGGGALLLVLFAAVRSRMGDWLRSLALGMVAMAVIWTGVNWTFSIGEEAALAMLVTTIGVGLGEFAKRFSNLKS